MADFDKWVRKPETKARLASAKKNAWGQFINQFPNADKNQFYAETRVDEKYRIAQKCFSMKARALQSACLAQTESIGARK